MIAEPNLEQLVEVALQLDRVLKTLKPEVNALARQKASLLESGEDEDNLPSDYASAGLDAVADLYAPRATADDDDDDDDDDGCHDR